MVETTEGKPIKRNRNIPIQFYVTEKELELITNRMEQTGIQNRRAYLLKMATDGQVIHLDISGVREMVRLLSNATNNINQIANHIDYCCSYRCCCCFQDTVDWSRQCSFRFNQRCTRHIKDGGILSHRFCAGTV